MYLPDPTLIPSPLLEAPAGCPMGAVRPVASCPRDVVVSATPREVLPVSRSTATPGGWWGFCAAAAAEATIPC